MKKLLLPALAALLAVSCKPMAPEKGVEKLYGYFNNEKFEQISYSAQTVDELALALAADADFNDLWTLDESDGSCNLIGEMPGEKSPQNTILICSSIGNWDGCTTIIEMMKAFKKLKIKPENTIKVAFYQPGIQADGIAPAGIATVSRSIMDKNDNILFNLELTDNPAVGQKTFIIGGERQAIYEKIVEVIPPYLSKFGNYNFMQGPEKDSLWLIDAPIYKYHTEGNLKEQAAALASFVFLMD